MRLLCGIKPVRQVQMSRLFTGEIAWLQSLRGMDEDRSQTDRQT